MRSFCAFLLLCASLYASAQPARLPAPKYPSLLWEITGKGLARPSYLFGTMHVSSKLAFHLSDSFYLALRGADVVALETNPETWQEDMARYDMEDAMSDMDWVGDMSPNDYLTASTLRAPAYEQLIPVALNANQSVLNHFLYRSYTSADFEEDTYLDLYIYQVGRRWGKKVCGVENFEESMRLMQEAYADAAREKGRGGRRYGGDNEFSTARMEEAYRTGNLDLLDTIQQVNSMSAAFDEKFLYRRNEIQAASIDSIIRTRAALFVGVGAAHLPGRRGVIEELRRKGYRLRPIRMVERDSRHKEAVEQIRVPVRFSRQVAQDSSFSVLLPGRWYRYGADEGPVDQQQYADMANGSYYTLTRLQTQAGLWGHDLEAVYRKVDSLLYEHVPGRLLTRKRIERNGYPGLEYTNRTRRGDYQRAQVFVTPFELLFFKMSGNGNYVQAGKEADQFFNSITFHTPKSGWQTWQPQAGGFRVELPHAPAVIEHGQRRFMATDAASKNFYEVIRTDIHHHGFVEEDSFDLGLLEESLAGSSYIERQLGRRHLKVGGYPALEAEYRLRDSGLLKARFLIQGPYYYTLLARGQKADAGMDRFLNSFAILPFTYGRAEKRTDTTLFFTVDSPLPLEKSARRPLLPDGFRDYLLSEEIENFAESGTYLDRLVAGDSTGEKIYISFYRQGRYDEEDDKENTAIAAKEWQVRNRRQHLLSTGFKVTAYELGQPNSSRIIRKKVFARNGIVYVLETQSDTLTAPSAFVRTFFDSFQPADTVQGADPQAQKAGLYFSDLLGADTTLRKKALYNINLVPLTGADLPKLRQAIEGLGWQEKNYFLHKLRFIRKLSELPDRPATDLLKELYVAAGDTADLQYTVLETLLLQQTPYSFGVFRDIVLQEPPVLGLGSAARTDPDYETTIDLVTQYEPYDASRYASRDESFLGPLSDSLALTAGIIRDLLPLVNLDDYEQPLMRLVAALADSGQIKAGDYRAYLDKFLLEARQEARRQVMVEKNRSISQAVKKAEDGEESGDRYSGNERSSGNRKLLLYARLLMPFWKEQPQVAALMNSLLASRDDRLRLGVALLHVQYGRPLPDTLLTSLAKQDALRYDLYEKLADLGRADLFPAAYAKQEDLARSRLLSTQRYQQPDTLVYLDLLPATVDGKPVQVLFFKYRNDREDPNWKIAMAGPYPDPGQVVHDKKIAKHKSGTDLTELTDTRLEGDRPVREQLQKLLRRQLNGLRKSASRFYQSDRGDVNIFMRYGQD